MLMDDGGTDFGGIDTSVAQPFTIAIHSVNDAPSFTKTKEKGFYRSVATIERL
jgi:hypothetical protein